MVHELNVAVPRPTVIQVPTVSLPLVLVHAEPGLAVTEPIEDPKDGPGHDLLPVTDQDWVIGDTWKGSAVQVEAQ